MKNRITLPLSVLALLACCPLAFAQATGQSPSAQKQATPPAATETQQKNIQEYIDLLRSDVRQQKAQIMGAMMKLDADQAAKFWPIYSEYDAELTKLNNMRTANVQEYARNYDQMTDANADKLIRTALNYRKQRSELLEKYYSRVKAVLGATEAARFVQIEDQLLMLVDLQITSSLPLARSGS
jgi:hypothetical protein